MEMRPFIKRRMGSLHKRSASGTKTLNSSFDSAPISDVYNAAAYNADHQTIHCIESECII